MGVGWLKKRVCPLSLKPSRMGVKTDMKNRTMILVFNPGSTSTKIALFDGMKEIASDDYSISTEELSNYQKLIDQVPMRAEQIRMFMKEYQIREEDIDLLVPRYPHFRSRIPGHAMSDEEMIRDCREQPEPFHIMQYSPLMLYEVFEDRIPIAIVDMLKYVEQPEELRLTGIPGIRRANSCHIENTISITATIAEQEGVPMEQEDLVVAHLGGGVSFNWVSEGKIRYRIFNGEGAFSPERAGAIPAIDLINLCFSGKYTRKEIEDFIRNKGGLVAYFGINDCRIIEKAIEEGDRRAKEVYDAMILSMIGSIGQVIAIAGKRAGKLVLTGGISRSAYVKDMIRSHLGGLLPIIDMAGEYEAEFFAMFGKDVLEERVEINAYESPC